MPFLHGAIRIYFSGATALARPVVAGRELNFGTKEGTDREADYMCFSSLRHKTSELEGEEYNEAKQSCGWNVPELQTT
jgi:hypothetical protein